MDSGGAGEAEPRGARETTHTREEGSKKKAIESVVKSSERLR